MTISNQSSSSMMQAGTPQARTRQSWKHGLVREYRQKWQHSIWDRTTERMSAQNSSSNLHTVLDGIEKVNDLAGVVLGYAPQAQMQLYARL